MASSNVAGNGIARAPILDRPESDNSLDHSATLRALRAISTAINNKATADVPHNTWRVAGVTRSGITQKKISERIQYIKKLVSALNKAECDELEFGERSGAFAMANGGTFHHIHSKRKGNKIGWNKSASRAGGRDRKMMLLDAQYGEMDMECDRLFYTSNGEVKAVQQ